MFRQKFGYTPTYVVKAPGCLELLGNHADLHCGLTLSVAINRHVSVACSPRLDGRIELASSAFRGAEKLWMSSLKPNPQTPWTSWIKGMLDKLRRRGVNFNGFNAAVHTTLQMGGGLGSSSALQVATALAVRELNPYRVTSSGVMRAPVRVRGGKLPRLSGDEKVQIARLCQDAARDFCGQDESLLAPMTSLNAKEFNALSIDFLHNTSESIPMIGDLALVYCPTGASSVDVAGQVAQRKLLCDSAARILNAKSLRSVEVSFVEKYRKSLSTRQHACAYHIVAENQRVVFADRALREGDWEQLGQYMFQSHESSREFFQNSTPELDLLVELARSHPACFGARLSGKGFGGGTVSLIEYSKIDDFTASIAGLYEKLTRKKIAPLFCRIVNGAT